MGLWGKVKAVERLEQRLAELETAHDKLGSTIRRLELEYIELYDKVRHQMSRMAKRYAPDPALHDVVQDDAPPDDGLDEISRAILARRNAGRPQT